MKKLLNKKFCKAMLLTLPILIVLQDVSYALSPPSRFSSTPDSEEQLSQPFVAPPHAETVSDIFKPQKELDSELRKNQETKPIVRMDGQIRPRILIVEDKAAWREKYKKLLSKWGYEPEFAEYGRKAVEIFRENPAGFALVISDLDLNEELPKGVPDMPGEEVITEIRKIHAKIKIIVISARNYTGDFELINYDPIPKPRFDAKPEILLEVLKKHFHILPATNKPPKDKPEEKRNEDGHNLSLAPSPAEDFWEKIKRAEGYTPSFIDLIQGIFVKHGIRPSLLDLGAGDNRFASEIEKEGIFDRVVGIDKSEYANRVRQAKFGRISIADAAEDPGYRHQFDILSVNAPKKEMHSDMFKAINSFLREDGRAMIFVRFYSFNETDQNCQLYKKELENLGFDVLFFKGLRDYPCTSFVRENALAVTIVGFRNDPGAGKSNKARKARKGDGSNLSSAESPIKNVSKEDRTAPISPTKDAIIENLKAVLERYDNPDAKAPPDFNEGQNLIRQILFAAEELPEAEEIKEEVAHILAKWVLELLDALAGQIKNMHKAEDFKGTIKAIDEKFLSQPIIKQVWNEEHRLPLFKEFEPKTGNHFLAHIRGSPLSRIYIYAQLIRKVRPADKKYSEYKEEIRKAIKDTEASLGRFRDKLAESLYEKKELAWGKTITPQDFKIVADYIIKGKPYRAKKDIKETALQQFLIRIIQQTCDVKEDDRLTKLQTKPQIALLKDIIYPSGKEALKAHLEEYRIRYKESLLPISMAAAGIKEDLTQAKLDLKPFLPVLEACLRLSFSGEIIVELTDKIRLNKEWVGVLKAAVSFYKQAKKLNQKKNVVNSDGLRRIFWGLLSEATYQVRGSKMLKLSEEDRMDIEEKLAQIFSTEAEKGDSSDLNTAFRNRTIIAKDISSGKEVFRGKVNEFFRAIPSLDNVRIEGDSLNSAGQLYVGDTPIATFINYRYCPITYEIHQGKVDRTTIILRDEEGNPLQEEGLRRAIDLKTGLLKCHLPELISRPLLNQLDNVRIEGGRLNSAGQLHVGGALIASFTDYRYCPITYEIHQGKVDRTTIILRDEEGSPLQEEGLRRAIDLKTGLLKCHLPELISRPLLNQLDNVRIEEGKLSSTGQLCVAGEKIAKFPKYANYAVSYEVHKGGVTLVKILNEKEEVIYEEVIKVARDLSGMAIRSYRGRGNNLLSKWLRKDIEQISTIEGSFVEKENYLILAKGLTYNFNFTQWGDFEGRPVKILFKKQGPKNENLPFNFYFPPWEGKEEVSIPAKDALYKPMAILFSRTVGQKGEEDEKGEAVVISPYDPVEIISKEEEIGLVQKAIAGLPPDKQELAKEIIAALAYIEEEDLQETSLWQEIARKLNIEEKEVIAVINALARSPSLESVGAEDSRHLEPFFKKHELRFQNIAAVIMAASELKKLVIDKNARKGDIHTKIGELNQFFYNGKIEIEIKEKIQTGFLKCSGKEYKCAVFHFKKEDKTINVLFLKDHAALTSDELKELRIQDIEKHHLDCPGLEGVWFINSPAISKQAGSVLPRPQPRIGGAREPGLEREEIQKKIKLLEDTKRKLENNEFPAIINFGDKHGVAADLERILQAAQDADKDGKRLVIIGHGDAFDRGNQSFRNFEILQKLKKIAERNPKISVYLCFGNHDVWVIQALLLNNAEAQDAWLNEGGIQVHDEFSARGADMRSLAIWMLKNLEIFHIDEMGFLHLHAGIPMDKNGNPLISMKQLKAWQDELDFIKQALNQDPAYKISESNRLRVAKLFDEAENIFWVRQDVWIANLMDGGEAAQIQIDERNKAKLFSLLEKSIKANIPSISKAQIEEQIKENWARILIQFEEQSKMAGIEFKLFGQEPKVNKDKLDRFLAQLGVNGVVFGHINAGELINIDNRIFCVDVYDVNSGDDGHLIFNGKGIKFNSMRRGEYLIAAPAAMLANIDAEIIRLKKRLGEGAAQEEATELLTKIVEGMKFGIMPPMAPKDLDLKAGDVLISKTGTRREILSINRATGIVQVERTDINGKVDRHEIDIADIVKAVQDGIARIEPASSTGPINVNNEKTAIEVRPAFIKEIAETRQAAIVEMLNVLEEKDNDVKVVVGVPIDMNKAKVQPALSAINRGLAKNGFGKIDDNKQVITFEIDINDSIKTAQNQESAVQKARDELASNGRVVLFAPQMERGPQLAGKAQEAYKDQSNITVVPDAYTDSAPEQNVFPDIMVRAALGRNIAFYYTGKDPQGTLTTINNLLAKIADGFVPIVTINDLLNILKPLRIRPVDFKTITDWQESQKAVATAL